MKLNIADMRKSFIDIPGHICVSIYFQGCSINCPECHNPELHEFKEGRVPVNMATNIIFMASDFIDSVALMGGEPLDQDIPSLCKFIEELYGIGIRVVCLYTGYHFDDIPEDILNRVNMLKYGKYGDPQVYMTKRKNKWEVMYIEV